MIKADPMDIGMFMEPFSCKNKRGDSRIRPKMVKGRVKWERMV